MAWKFGGVYVRTKEEMSLNKVLDRLQLSFEPTEEQINLDAATSSGFLDTAIREFNEVFMIHNNFIPYDCAIEPGKFYEFDEILSSASMEMDILCFFLDGITSSYGLSFFRGGKRVRCVGVLFGKEVLNEGEPLPGEQDMQNSDEEARMFGSISGFLGIPIKELLADNTFLLDVYAQKKSPGDNTEPKIL